MLSGSLFYKSSRGSEVTFSTVAIWNANSFGILFKTYNCKGREHLFMLIVYTHGQNHRFEPTTLIRK